MSASAAVRPGIAQASDVSRHLDLGVTLGEEEPELPPPVLQTEIVNLDFDPAGRAEARGGRLPTMTDAVRLVQIGPGQFDVPEPLAARFHAPDSCSDYRATVSFRLLFEPELMPKAEFPDVGGIRMESSRGEPVVVNLWQEWAIGVSWLYVIE